MDIHQNARLTLRSREDLVESVKGGMRFSHAAHSFHVTAKTAAKWVRRYQSEGTPGLRDRSSRPQRSPKATSSGQIEQVIALRRQFACWGRSVFSGIAKSPNTPQFFAAAA
jgi:transposase